MCVLIADSHFYTVETGTASWSNYTPMKKINFKESLKKKHGLKVLPLEVIAFAATWMKLESVKLSEVIQTEKDKSHMIDRANRLWLWAGNGEDGLGVWKLYKKEYM